MNQEKTTRAEADLEIESILAGEEELIPSSGFLAVVMERVQEEAAAPPPIPFPWKRAVPGLLMIAGLVGWGVVELVRYGLPASALLTLNLPVQRHLSAALAASAEPACWIALALGISFASWLLSLRLAGSRGLL